MATNCDCDLWQENISILNNSQACAIIHGWENEIAPFEYCPWCGQCLSGDPQRDKDADKAEEAGDE